MAWTTNPYCTVADVQTYLDLQNVQDGSFLAPLVVEAQAAIDSYLGFSFQTDGTTGTPAIRTYNGNNGRQLPIDDCVTLVTVLETSYAVGTDSSGNYTRSQTQQDITADVALGPANPGVNGDPGFLLERYSDDVFVQGRGNYEVHGIFGWPTIPADIARACKRLAGHYYRMRDAAYTDQTGESQFGKMMYRTQMPRDVVDILDNYRRRLFLGW